VKVGRGVRLVYDEACGSGDARRCAKGPYYSEGNGCEWNVGRCGLADHDSCGGHRLATLLAPIVMPHALHRLAALHSLLRSSSWTAIESISHDCNREQNRKGCFRKGHCDQLRGVR
jgi:hypothetical protein